MKFSIKFEAIVVLICCLGKILCGVCPTNVKLDPCTCNNGSSTIICASDKGVNLKDIFALISNNTKDKNFEEFVLTNSAITVLEDNVFGDIKFKKMTFTDTFNLNRISSKSLNASAFTLQEFRHMGENKLGDEYIEELFNALSSLVSVNRIFLSLTQATKLPDNAFKVINGRQSSLESIHLNYVGGKYGSLTSIGNNAFYPLDKLKFISIANQPIKTLKAKAFDFENPLTDDLDLHMEATKITAESFEEGIFLNAKRPITVEMSHTNVTYLPEKVFKPIFALNATKMVTFIMEGNALVCDCKMQWVFNDKERLKLRLLEPNCKTGPSLWELTKADFANC